MRKIVGILVVFMVLASGCIGNEDVKAKTPGTSQPEPSTAILFSTTPVSPREENFNSLPLTIGRVTPSDPLCGLDPSEAISQFIGALRDDYSLKPTEPDFPVPEESLASEVFEVSEVSGAYMGVFAYPDYYSASRALEDLKEKLNIKANTTDGFQWEGKGKDALYSAFSMYFRGFYLVVLFKVPYSQDLIDDAEYTLKDLMFHAMWVGPSPRKMLGLFMHTRILNQTWGSNVFSGDLLSVSGLTPEGARIEVAVYRKGCGWEVYDKLKEKIEKLSFREKALPQLKSHDPAGKVVQRAYFEGDLGVYIELYQGPGMNRVTLIYGNKSTVKAAVLNMWSEGSSAG
jgi:hypothetical protein